MKIQVNNPCGESWEGMSPSGNGRHCSACEKVVVDFTQMSDEEVMQYFHRPKEEKVCGRFNNTQLNRTLEPEMLLNAPLPFKNGSSGIHLFGYILFFSAVLAMASCNDHTTGEPMMSMGDTVIVDTANSGNKRGELGKLNELDSVKNVKECGGVERNFPTTVMGKPQYMMGEVVEEVTTGVPEVVQLMGDTIIVDQNSKK